MTDQLDMAWQSHAARAYCKAFLDNIEADGQNWSSALAEVHRTLAELFKACGYEVWDADNE